MVAPVAQAAIKAGVIGWPIAHSRSPLIHNHWMQQYEMDAAYSLCPIDPADDFRAALQRLADAGYVGANVTLPHKENAFQAMDELTPAAAALGAVNTISFKDGKICGANTDGGGFIASLDEGAPGHAWRDKPVLLIGAGGAARALIVALAAAGVPEIRLTNRTRARAEALQELAGGALHIGDWERRGALAAGCGLLVNTTGLGMDKNPPLDMPLDAMGADGLVCDIVYTPLETDFMRAAKQRRLKTIGGLGMLLHQAALSFDIWFAIKPQIDEALRAKLTADIQGA